MTTSMPRIMVGVPTYNRAQRLVRAIRSIQASEYPNIAILIADNASADDTPEVAAELARQDPRIRYIRHADNRGPVANLKYCWDQCREPYFMWLADDDVVDPGYMVRCIEALEQDRSLVLVSGVPFYRRLDGSLYPGVPTNLLDARPAVRVLQYFRAVADNGVLYGVYRRDALELCELKRHLGHDWMWLAEVASCGRVRTLESTQLTREDSWSEAGSRREYFRRVVKVLGLPKFVARMPTLTIAAAVVHGIGMDSRAFGRMPGLERIAVAVIAAGLLGARGGYSQMRGWLGALRGKAG